MSQDKIKQSFIAIKTKETARRMGGCNYTLEIYENKGIGKFIHVATHQACTAAHKGYESEAYTALRDANVIKPRIKTQIRKFCAMPENKKYSYNSYYTWRMKEIFGLEIVLIS